MLDIQFLDNSHATTAQKKWQRRERKRLHHRHVHCHDKFGPPSFCSPRSKYFEIFGPPSPNISKILYGPLLKYLNPPRLDHFHTRSWPIVTRLWLTKSYLGYDTIRYNYMVGPKGNFCHGCCIFRGSVLETLNLQCELSVAKTVTELCNLLINTGKFAC